MAEVRDTNVQNEFLEIKVEKYLYIKIRNIAN